MDDIIKNILDQLNIMSYLNVLSFSVLSGSGTSVSPSLHDLDVIEELCKDMPPNQRPYNIFFMDSLYKRNAPIYAKKIDNPYNFESYQWLDRKRKETIDIEVMACSIICCCSLIERLITNQIILENNQFIAYILFKTALHQTKFIKHHLKIGELYYSGEDISENSKELHIQIAPKEPDIVSQLSVLHAFAALKRLGNYNIPYMQLKHDEFEEDLDLRHPLYADILKHISDIKSRDLVNIGLSIIGIYVSDNASCKAAYNALGKIGSELINRLSENGEITRTGADILESSSVTLFNSLNFLSQLYYMFGGKSLYHACSKIYNKLNDSWDKKHGIFKLKDSNKQSYSIKDISSAIAALLSFNCILSDSKMIELLEEQVKGMYETGFIKSHIFNGQHQPILQQFIMDLPASEEPVENTAPVFYKAFEYKLSKGKFYCDADVFRADYVMYACCLLLNNISNYCI